MDKEKIKGPVLPNYSKKELDKALWLRMSVRTVGIRGSANRQESDELFDFKNACQKCGSGAVPTAPLILDLNKMGKKKLERTTHDGCLIITSELGNSLLESRFTGFSLLSVRHYAKKEISLDFKWLKIESVWPRMNQKSVLAINDRCPLCKRSGHYDTYDKLTKFVYEQPPGDAKDFNLTWEYFGRWRAPMITKKRVGGCQEIIVSQKVRRFFIDRKVRNLEYSPIFFSN